MTGVSLTATGSEVGARLVKPPSVDGSWVTGFSLIKYLCGNLKCKHSVDLKHFQVSLVLFFHFLHAFGKNAALESVLSSLALLKLNENWSLAGWLFFLSPLPPSASLFVSHPESSISWYKNPSKTSAGKYCWKAVKMMHLVFWNIETCSHDLSTSDRCNQTKSGHWTQKS